MGTSSTLHPVISPASPNRANEWKVSYPARIRLWDLSQISLQFNETFGPLVFAAKLRVEILPDLSALSFRSITQL